MYTLKKSLGQHFLHDEIVCRKIVDALKGCDYKKLIEVGPGGGALTKYLLEIPNIEFKAIELDKEKVEYLRKTYPALEGKIIEGSILDISIPFEQPFAVIGNFPYNISTEIVFKIIGWRDLVDCMIGMFQKEVADRIAASEGSKVYGVTSVLTQAFFDVNYLFDVEPEKFIPPPKVMSGVIRFEPRKDPIEMSSERQLFLLVKTAFNQRRKTLRNAVRGLFDSTVLQDEIFNKRAEQLSVEDFASLTFKMR